MIAVAAREVFSPNSCSRTTIEGVTHRFEFDETTFYKCLPTGEEGCMNVSVVVFLEIDEVGERAMGEDLHVRGRFAKSVPNLTLRYSHHADLFRLRTREVCCVNSTCQTGSLRAAVYEEHNIFANEVERGVMIMQANNIDTPSVGNVFAPMVCAYHFDNLFH